MKRCCRCGVDKAETEFNWRYKARGIRKNECRACCKADYVRYRAKDPAAHNAASKERKRKWRAEHPNSVKEWYAANRAKERARYLLRAGTEKYKRTRKAWVDRNRDKVRASTKKWNDAHRELIRAYFQAHYQANKARYSERGRLRRARERAATIIPFSPKDLDARMSVFGHRCAYCGGPFEHVDHVKPLSRGGPHCLSNLRPSCAECNLRKFVTSPRAWLSRAS